MLHQLLKEKLEALRTARRRGDLLVSERETDEVDEATVEVERDLAVSFINTDWHVTHAVEAALERLEAGEYGICEFCGEPISPKRLKAIPWATRCATCQARLEDGEGTGIYRAAA